MNQAMLIPRRIAIALITLYQKTLSPDHGLFRAKYPYGFCKFYPSCSEYTKIAIKNNGVMKGGAQGLWRIARCNPFANPKIELNELKN